MRTLEHALVEHELITLRVIGEWWELDLAGADKIACVKALAQTLSGLDMKAELNYLAPEEAGALRDLADAGGRMPVATFSRQHGEVRLMGPGRLEREEPWFDTISPSEALWYRGFLYRGFDETEEGVVEFCFLPHELQDTMPRTAAEQEGGPPTLPAVASPDKFNEAVTDVVDDMATLLALAQREGVQEEMSAGMSPYLQNPDPLRLKLLAQLALEQKLLRATPEGLKPARPAVDWLQEGREAQLRTLMDAWRSSSWNELGHTPGLACEGSGWANDPLLARSALLQALPQDSHWYAIQDVIALVRETNPDFQRPDGNYDTWYVRDLASDEYVTGFSNWDLVEGRLLRFLLTVPMKWLGLVEMADDRLRLTERALSWLANGPPAGTGVQVPLIVQPDATLLVPHNANRYHRFQAARIAEPGPFEVGRPYLYQITPQSLEQAREQGITPERVLKFLAQAGGRTVPASVSRAIERWAEKGAEARLQSLVVLRVENAEILSTMLADKRTRPFLGERLGDLAVIIQQEDWQEFRNVAARLGLLLDLVE